MTSSATEIEIFHQIQEREREIERGIHPLLYFQDPLNKLIFINKRNIAPTYPLCIEHQTQGLKILWLYDGLCLLLFKV